MNLASPSTRVPTRSLLTNPRSRNSRRPLHDVAYSAGTRRPSSTDPYEDDIELQKRGPPDGGGGSESGDGREEGGAGLRGRSGASHSSSETESTGRGQRQQQDGRSALISKTWTVLKTQMKYLGPGITMSVAYCDPGNWATDLRAGSQFGYPLLFIIILTGIFGIILQVLALRMGIVCNKDLAVLTREWVLSLGKNKRPSSGSRDPALVGGREVQDTTAALPPTRKSVWAQRGRLGLLWLLYFVAEAAIICTELAELVGSAIALNLLFPGLPLWGGVLVTSADVFLILLIYKPDTRSLRIFEFCVAILVFIVISCLIALVVRVDPHWPDVFKGYLPSATVVEPQPLYVAIGILGATVMPHGLFLGSHFSCFEREAPTTKKAGLARTFDEEERDSLDADEELAQLSQPQEVPPSATFAHRLQRIRARVVAAFDGDIPPSADFDEDAVVAPPARELPAINRRILHSTIDVAASMVLFAITTNSALLIIAAQAFYFGLDGSSGDRGGLVIGDLFQAFDLIKERLNHVFAILFAVALLASGQSASITVTLAGQVISEGMIKWKTNPFLRRCLTRGITLIPSFAVAAGIGRAGLDNLLVASQVALSMALPFVLLPLLAITASKFWMGTEILPPSPTEGDGEGGSEVEAVSSRREEHRLQATTEALSASASLTPSTAFEEERQRWHIQPGLLLRWSWWTRGAGKVAEEKWPRPRTATGGTVSPNERAEALLEPARPVPGLDSQARLSTHFASGWISIAITSAIYVIIVISNVYVIVTTAIGIGGT